MIILKSLGEIELMRKSAKIAAEVLESMGEMAKPGMKTAELDRYGNSLILKSGAISAFKDYRGYPAFTCISVNEEVVHGIPSERKLKEGDIVSIDVGVFKNGFFGDVAATFPVGQISEEAEVLARVTKDCLAAALEKVNTENRMGDVSFAVQSLAEKNGFSVVRVFTGHGIGRSLHEDLQVPNFGKAGTGIRLKDGMTFCIEPMVNAGVCEVDIGKDGWTVTTKDKKLSAHFEAQVAVVDGHAQVLTDLGSN